LVLQDPLLFRVPNNASTLTRPCLLPLCCYSSIISHCLSAITDDALHFLDCVLLFYFAFSVHDLTILSASTSSTTRPNWIAFNAPRTPTLLRHMYLQLLSLFQRALHTKQFAFPTVLRLSFSARNVSHPFVWPATAHSNPQSL
jgi:hypothetical protein